MFFGCEQPIDPVIQSVNITNDVFIKHDWKLKQFYIDVKRDHIPAPVLWNLSDMSASRYFGLLKLEDNL